uniref:Peptidase_M13 domain-containing protein n=1 Tax=Strongyloides papillosus TaxID=174720 RepID=A0A0N5BGY6_STREA
MIVRIKEELKLLIDEKKDIFDEETRKHFLHKLTTMKFKKNFDHYDLSNIKAMDSCYENVDFIFKYNNPKNAIKTIKKIRERSFRHDDDLNYCRGKIFQTNKYLDDFIYSNAFYNSTGNYFSINSDYLNEPSFSKNFPMSLNYGYLGVTIAHEMLHAFDSENYNRTLYDDYESIFNVTQISVENSKEKSKCFVRQYGMQKESITNKNINGLRTLNENIADNGELKIAHRAYIKYLQSIDNIDLIVNGLGIYTKEQLFFISYGKKRCEYRSKDKLEIQIYTSKYGPSEICTHIALSNYKPFSDAFNC